MNTFNRDQLKPSAASTFNYADISKLTKSRSFRAKLKSKILKPRKSLTSKLQKNSAYFSSFNITNKSKIEATHQNVVVTAICKIMNKSLGLFRSNTKKSKKISDTYQRYEYPEPALAHFNEDTQCSISLNNFDSINHNECSYESNFNDNYCVSTPKKSSSPRDFNEIYQLEKISMLDFNHQTNSPIHSTPEHKKTLSPIFVPISKPTLSSTISTTSSVSLISGNRLKSFAMTSSPMSLRNSLESVSNSSESIRSSSLYQYENDMELSHECKPIQMQQFEEEIDYNQHKLINHLNNIKRNVRLSVELRNVKSNKRSFYEMNNEAVTMNTKKQRLQNIFRSKINRQLKEIKSWKMGSKNKLGSSFSNGNVCNDQFCECQNYYMI